MKKRKTLTVKQKIINFMTKHKYMYFTSKEIARRCRVNWNSVRRELISLNLHRWNTPTVGMEYRLLTS